MWQQWSDLLTLIDQDMVELLHKKYHGRLSMTITQFVVWYKDFHYIWKVCICKDLYIEISKHQMCCMMLKKDGSWVFPISMIFNVHWEFWALGFWRALKILKPVQRGVPCHEVVFTKKANIYSFGMLCYEIITRHIPFEGHPQSNHNIVLIGERPKLPDDFNSNLKDLILECWHHDPQQRPSAFDIFWRLSSFNLSVRGIIIDGYAINVLKAHKYYHRKERDDTSDVNALRLL